MSLTHRSHETPKGSAAFPLLPKWTDSEGVNLVVYAAVPEFHYGDGGQTDASL